MISRLLGEKNRPVPTPISTIEISTVAGPLAVPIRSIAR